MDDVTQKLTAARTRLILDKPFLGALVLRLPLIEADPAWCDTSATDARSLYYNRSYMGQLNLAQVQLYWRTKHYTVHVHILPVDPLGMAIVGMWPAIMRSI